jgi:hypothetical protein
MLALLYSSSMRAGVYQPAGLAVDCCVMVVNLICWAIKIDFLLGITGKHAYRAHRYLERGDLDVPLADAGRRWTAHILPVRQGRAFAAPAPQ